MKTEDIDRGLPELNVSPGWLQTALSLVEPENRDEFLEFIKTGEASETYMAHIDACTGCQKAVDMIMEQSAEAMQAIFHKNCPGPCPPNSNFNPPKKSNKFLWLYSVAAISSGISLVFMNGQIFGFLIGTLLTTALFFGWRRT